MSNSDSTQYFDPGQWYHIYVNENEDVSFISTNLFRNGTTGAAFFEAANLTDSQQRWQLYAVNSTYYVLRTKEGGPNAFLATQFSVNETTPGQTRAHMIRGNESDDSIFWRVLPWHDGTFALTNKRNNTNWHLARTESPNPNPNLAAMDSNTTNTPKGQRFSFKSIQAIQNDRFSTVDLPSETVNSPASITPTADPSSTNGSNSSSGSGGLSTGAKAAIGASIGGVALIALIVFGLFWRRRRQRQPQAVEKYSEGSYDASQGQSAPVAHEMQHEGPVKYEMDQRQYDHPVELQSNAPPVELPSSPANAR